MQYYSRQGIPIKEKDWRKVSRIPSYTNVLPAKKVLGGSARLRCCWVGVFLPAFEKTKRLFIVCLEVSDKEGSSEAFKFRPGKDIWVETEEEAIEVFFRRLKELT